jgi:anti-sigma factor RsiW
MMDHLTSEQLIELVDGALGGEARAVLESHIAGCEHCAAAAASLRAIEAVARALPPVRTSQDFTARTMARLPIDAPVPRRTMLVRHTVQLAAALLVVALYLWVDLWEDQTQLQPATGWHLRPVAALGDLLVRFGREFTELFTGGTWTLFIMGIGLIALLLTLDKAFLSKILRPRH